MSADFDSITNRGEYLSAYYFAEQLAADLKKNLFAEWTMREQDERDRCQRDEPDEPQEHETRSTPRQQIRRLRGRYWDDGVRRYFAEAADQDSKDGAGLRTFNDPEWIKRLTDWHQDVLRALGHDPAPTDLTVYRAGREHTVRVACHSPGIVALDCGFADNADAALDPDGAGRLLFPLEVSAAESYQTGPALASWLLHSELGGPGGPSPRFVILLHGGVIILADRNAWSEGRYLAANLDTALERNDRSQQGELPTIAALFSLDMLRPGDNDQAPAIDTLLKASGDNAAGVSSDLRYGLQRSVEIIANEVLRRLAEHDVAPADIERPTMPFARELTRETLRYLYRILFLLYAEARPELGILPADDGTYEAGYSMARLRELVDRDEQLVDEEARNSFHLYESLDVLFTKVNNGHRPYGTEPDDDQPGDDVEIRRAKAARRSEDRGLRFEPLRSDLFEPGAVRLIGRNVADPHAENDPSLPPLDLRLSNVALHEVLRLLTKKPGRSGERGGFVSYRNLGINQLGAVYEGLMSYTGIIASEELCEVAKGGDPEDGSWLIPSRQRDKYPDMTLVRYSDSDAAKGLRGVKRYQKGSFVYRLAGRDRETTASYYTPESLTNVTVELALKHRLSYAGEDKSISTRAAELLRYKICEPALGSGAFANEAINQLADLYLRLRQDELGVAIPTAVALTEKQKVKAYIALHNVYGVDLNATGVELAEVSLWLNTMHPGMQAPWFGLHLRRGNSLIGARRAAYPGAEVASAKKRWLKTADPLPPTPLPFRTEGIERPLPDGAIHQFLLPSLGWASVAGTKEARELAPEQSEQLAAWRRSLRKRPTAKQVARLQRLAKRAEYLWRLVIKRMQISERDVSRRIDIWGADPSDPEFGFLHQPAKVAPKEKVFAELFKAVDTPYWRLKMVMDSWCALWFWPLHEVGLLDGADSEYSVASTVISPEGLFEVLGDVPTTGSNRAAGSDALAHPTLVDDAERAFVTQPALFPSAYEQMPLDGLIRHQAPTTASHRKQGSKLKAAPRRPTIGLTDLADWLDFLESMLGTGDMPQGTLIDGLDNLDDLKRVEDSLAGFMHLDTADPEQRYPWVRLVRDIADEQGFLHWELEFAHVFAHHGGFDLQVGNPPWVRPSWNEASVLAEYEPWFALQDKESKQEKHRRRTEALKVPAVLRHLLRERTDVEAKSELLGSPQVYPLLAGTQPDLYRAFMCQVWAHASPKGTIGMIHPDTHFTGDREGALREEAYRRLRIHGDFVNAGNRFFPHPVGRSTHFGVHIYGVPGTVKFDHLSWLFSVDALRLSSLDDGTGPDPGVRFNGTWDARPHQKRLVKVDVDVLAKWQQLLGDSEGPPVHGRLLFPVSTAEAQAIEAIAGYGLRLGSLSPQISSGFHESSSREAGLIEFNHTDSSGCLLKPNSWDEVILKGPQLGVANPFFKQPSRNADHRDFLGLNLVELSDAAVPETEYVPAADWQDFAAAQDKWVDYQLINLMRSSPEKVIMLRGESPPTSSPEIRNADPLTFAQSRKPYSEFYRLAWRSMIAPNTERALFSALIPPGPTHVHAVQSMALPDPRLTALVAGFWASIPMDYLLRTTGRTNLLVASAKMTPAPQSTHPLASALLLRTLRLNCLTNAYEQLWAELYEPSWHDEPWAINWSGLPALHGLTSEWQHEVPLRTERSRRSALVEIDALVAVWLGMSSEALVAAYRARFPVLQDYEAVTWFDTNGRKLAGSRNAYGQGQTKEHWDQFDPNDPNREPSPEGYRPPFYKAEREKEMRAAHAVFQARLDAAVERGEWDPVRREVRR
jgi:hypothetical protein